MSEERRAARLSAWVDRELRALLQTDDVAIVRAYVIGLVRGIGFSRSGGDAEAQAAPPQVCSAVSVCGSPLKCVLYAEWVLHAEWVVRGMECVRQDKSSFVVSGALEER